MNIAVMSLTRDRLDYTQHCFGTLLEHAGCEFDWWIADQGSEDGTVDWLLENTDATVTAYESNAGITPALNAMLDDIVESADYDVIVKVDNDCELLTPNTLRDVCEQTLDLHAVLSPHIQGLVQPPVVTHAFGPVSVTKVVGGIFMAVPASLFKSGYRHPVNATQDGDDWMLCRYFQARGGFVGYLDGYQANHYETTEGQWARYPEYFARRQQERVDAEMVAA